MHSSFLCYRTAPIIVFLTCLCIGSARADDVSISAYLGCQANQTEVYNFAGGYRAYAGALPTGNGFFSGGHVKCLIPRPVGSNTITGIEVHYARGGESWFSNCRVYSRSRYGHLSVSFTDPNYVLGNQSFSLNLPSQFYFGTVELDCALDPNDVFYGFRYQTK